MNPSSNKAEKVAARAQDVKRQAEVSRPAQGNTLSVKARLLMGFTFTTIVGALVAAIGIFSMSVLDDELEKMHSTHLTGVSYVKEAGFRLALIGRHARSVMLAPSAEARNRFNEAVTHVRRGFRENLDKARPMLTSERSKSVLAELDRDLLEYNANVDKLMAMMNKASGQLGKDGLIADDREIVAFLFDIAGPKAVVLEKGLEALIVEKQREAEVAAEEARKLYHRNRNIMIGLVIASLVLGALIGQVITRRLARQLGGEPDYAAHIAEQVAAGNLGVAIDLRPEDAGSLLFALKRMRDSLSTMVHQVRSTTEMVVTAANEIASGNMDLSSRTERQASALQETASSLDELTSTVKQNADNARQADQLAHSASGVAAQGGEVVRAVVETMDDIRASSAKIADIISVIDGIAFQTNILALNAAVEAARAGEQGRGFAVVASEVRTLAQRSASAAKEIKELIEASVTKVETGVAQAGDAGKTMQSIVTEIQKVADLIGEITAASREQSAGIEQVNRAVTQMDESTQHNAALVEESAAAAQSLLEQANRLSKQVEVFKTT